jgi:hypothetical protein
MKISRVKLQMRWLVEENLILEYLQADGKFISTSEFQSSFKISHSLLRKILISLTVLYHMRETERKFSLMGR